MAKFPKPISECKPNTLIFENKPLIKPTGFREYDARWWFGFEGNSKAPEINLMGFQAVGMGIGTLLHEQGVVPKIVVGHDFRSYSQCIKSALVSGLMATGCEVHDIGLSLSPMAYYAQFALDLPAVAMVTASHNDNGWSGVKIGSARPLTFGPDEMSLLKQYVLLGQFDLRGGGHYTFVENMAGHYLEHLTDRAGFSRKLKVVIACGNGTASAFAPHVFEALGCDVVSMDCELDHTFPRYNPNPEDMVMLNELSKTVLESGADVGFGFDGDGDRCGVVDDEGEEIFADKIGVMLARDLSAKHKNSVFVVDVKSTGLFKTDPVLQANGAQVDFWKTGHSYIKRRVRELRAIAGFEKSGHFFFNPPLGYGYDDGLLSALAVCDMLESSPDKTMAQLKRDLPKTWQTPTMSPYCADEVKYQVVERIVKNLEDQFEKGKPFAGARIVDLIRVNGARIVCEDGTWGLIRASSNKPELVVVVESPVSETRMREMFASINEILQKNPEIGEYNQKI